MLVVVPGVEKSRKDMLLLSVVRGVVRRRCDGREAATPFLGATSMVVGERLPILVDEERVSSNRGINTVN
jgi:hypothetical protein